jgi:polysaccharide biosynthesis protein PslH
MSIVSLFYQCTTVVYQRVPSIRHNCSNGLFEYEEKFSEVVCLRMKCGKGEHIQILFVATNLPVPANSGQAIRSLSIIRALAESGHELNFVSFAGRGQAEAPELLSSYCREIDLLEREITNMSQRADYLKRGVCLLLFKPYSLERFRCEAMQATIQRQLSAKRFDLIVCDGLYALVNVPQTKVPIALNCHNVEYVIFKRYSQVEKNFFKKCYAILETHLMRDAERRSCHRSAIAMACSNDDRDVLHQLLADLPIIVVPNAVDTDSYPPDESLSSGNSSPILLFQGAMDWYPNRDAVEFFIRTVLPLVRAECPTVRFIVAGRNPPVRFVQEFGAYAGVEFTGTVPDMRPYLSAATVVVVPLRLGSGTRIKILEACAAGKPVVSTSVGAEGLDLQAGREIILADDPAQFSRSVVTLLRDPVRRSAIGTLARNVIVERYSHLALKRSLKELISTFKQADSLRAVGEPN